jgi:RNA polymerase sigma-70 factor (ECF subfamily)
MLSPTPNSRDTSQEDADFLERTFVAHQGALHHYATRLLGDPDRARDVVQDTFVKLMAQPPAAVASHTVEWLYTVCRHRAFDVLRKDVRLTRFADGQMERVTASEPRPGRALEEAETRVAILALISQLPPNQQEVVRLKFQHGFSYKEISRITALSVGNVGFLIHTAVARLRADYAAQRP